MKKLNERNLAEAVCRRTNKTNIAEAAKDIKALLDELAELYVHGTYEMSEVVALIEKHAQAS